MVNYFEGIPGVGRMPSFTNPATWMVSVVAAATLEDMDTSTRNAAAAESSAAVDSETGRSGSGGVKSSVKFVVNEEGGDKEEEAGVASAAAAITAPTTTTGASSFTATRIIPVSSRDADRVTALQSGATRLPPRLALAYKMSPSASRIDAAVDAVLSSGAPASSTATSTSAQQPGGGASFLTQVLVLTQRALLESYRNRTYNPIRVPIYVFLALFFGLIYYDIGGKATDQSGVLSAVAVILTATSFYGLLNLVMGLPVSQ